MKDYIVMGFCKLYSVMGLLLIISNKLILASYYVTTNERIPYEA